MKGSGDKDSRRLTLVVGAVIIFLVAVFMFTDCSLDVLLATLKRVV